MPQADTPGVSGITPPTNVQEPVVPGSPTIASAASSPTTSQSVPYERFAEVNRQKAELQAELERYKSETARVQEDPVAPQDEATREYYKKVLKFADTNEVSEVKKELENLKRQQFDNYLMIQAKDLENKYNGSDGKPKFELQEVLGYSAQNNIPNLEAAYKAYAFEKMQAEQAAQPTYVESSSQATTTFEPMKEPTDEEWNSMSKADREKWLDNMAKLLPHAN